MTVSVLRLYDVVCIRKLQRRESFKWSLLSLPRNTRYLMNTRYMMNTHDEYEVHDEYQAHDEYEVVES